MTEDAIPDDVSTEVEETKVIDERLDAIEALASKRADEIADEVSKAVENTEDQEYTEEVVEPKADEDQTEQLVKVKVDGEEVELPLSEVTKGYQKDATASKRLDQVAYERQQLNKEKQELEALKQEGIKQEQAEENIDSNYVEKLRNALDDLSVGNEQEQANAALALKELLGRGDNPAIQEEQIVSQATHQATQNALLEIQYTDAHRKFVEDYQDIISDPMLDKMALDAFNRAVPESQTYEEAFTAAGDGVRKWKDGLVGTSKALDKTALKERLHKEPVSVGSRAERPPEKKPETQSDIIAAIKASRGQ